MKKTQVLKRIDKLLQAKYIGFNEKKYLLKIRNLFLDSFALDNIEEYEKKLYKDRNYEQKFKFELTRIMDFMRNIDRDGDDDFLNTIEYIKTKEEMLNMINEDREVTYHELLLDLIELELKLNLKIALFVEFREYVEKCLYKMENDLTISTDIRRKKRNG